MDSPRSRTDAGDRRRRRPLPRGAGLAAACVLAAATAASAATGAAMSAATGAARQPERDPRIRALPPMPVAEPASIDASILADLASPDYRVRAAATRRLLAINGLRPGQAAHLADGLSLEARHRLLAVCRITHVEAPRGALGINHMPPGIEAAGPPDGPRGQVVRQLVPGFDAARRLQENDLLLRVDGRDIRADRDLAFAVQLRRPGDAIEIDLLRPRRDPAGPIIRENGRIVYDPMTVTVRLGDYDDLDNGDFAGRRDERSVAGQRLRDLEALRSKVIPAPRRLAIPADAGLRADDPVRVPGGRVPSRRPRG